MKVFRSSELMRFQDEPQHLENLSMRILRSERVQKKLDFFATVNNVATALTFASNYFQIGRHAQYLHGFACAHCCGFLE
jgi:hypothetical protein